MRLFFATILLVLISSAAAAQEPTMQHRFGPGAHFLDSRPLQKATHKPNRRHAHKAAPDRRAIVRAPVSQSEPLQTHERVWAAISKPSRYIAGRLICALNVNSALEERGIKGTGSALAASFLKWGHPSAPVPGAVAFNYRRGGGHVAIVAKIEGGRIWVWNPSPRGRGWQLRINRYASIYRAAS